MTPSPTDRTDALLAEASFVQRLARALVRDPATADDVSQEVMAMAWQQRTEPHSWRNWLATVTRRLASRARRADETRARHETLAASAPRAAEHPTEQRLRLQHALTEAVLALPEPYRTVVTLRFFDGLPPREIARRTRAPGSTVRQQLRRGLALLRQRLDREFGSRSQWFAAVAAIGIGSTSLPVLTLSVLVMNKLAVAATVLVAASAYFLLPDAGGDDGAPVVVADRERTAVPTADAAVGDPRVAIGERESVPAAATVCEVIVVGPDRAPLRDVVVHGWGRDGGLARERTDEHGRARFVGGGPGGVLVLATGCAPAAIELDERTGRHRIAVAAGELLAGVLTIDGLPAPPGTELPVRGEGSFAVAANVPEQLRAELQWRVPKPIVVGANGRFALRGLPANWRGYLYLGQRLWLLPASGGTPQSHDNLSLAAPRDDLDVRTTRLPSVVGHVVWADTGEPVSEPFVDAFAKFDDGTQSPGIAAQGDERGRFEIGLSPSGQDVYLQWCDRSKRPAVASVQLGANTVGAQRGSRITLTAEQLLHGPHVLRLARSSVTHFVAVDGQQRPIADARVEALGVSEPTDASGRGSFAGTVAQVRTVGAPGFAIEPLVPQRPAAGTREDPVRFVLRPVSRVRVRIVGSDDRPAVAHYLRLAADVAPFAGGRLSSALDKRIYGTAISSQTMGAGGSDFVAGLQMPDDGVLELRSLEPGVVVRLSAWDRVGHEVASIAVTVPFEGGEAQQTLRIDAPLRHIAGRVVDEHGNGVAKATLRIGGSAITAGRDGEVRLHPVYASGSLSMIVTAPGHVALATEVTATGLDERRQWTMQRARRVTLRIVDPNGEPVALRARVDGVRAERQQLEPGVLMFDNLPAGEVRFLASIGAVSFSLVHDARRPEAVMTVPRPGLLSVSMAAWPDPSANGELVAIATPLTGDGQPTRIWRPDRVAASPSMLVPGRYRITLLEQRGGGEDRVDVPLGLHAEVDVVAGETATASLRPR